MNINNRILFLQKEHTRLDKEIDTMEKTGHFTDDQLNKLKRQRLVIKDELSGLHRKQYEEREYVDFDDDDR